MAMGIFLEVAGAKGEAQNEKHKDTIQCESFSWGASNATTVSRGGGAGSALGNPHDLLVTAKIDKAYPVLHQYCLAGEHVNKVTLYVAKMGGNQMDFLKVELTDTVYCTQAQIGGTSGGDEQPMVTYGFNAGKVKATYTEQTKEGAPGASTDRTFDIKQNKKA